MSGFVSVHVFLYLFGKTRKSEGPVVQVDSAKDLEGFLGKILASLHPSMKKQTARRFDFFFRES